jgi:hypothetical protein
MGILSVNFEIEIFCSLRGIQPLTNYKRNNTKPKGLRARSEERGLEKTTKRFDSSISRNPTKNIVRKHLKTGILTRWAFCVKNRRGGVNIFGC